MGMLEQGLPKTEIARHRSTIHRKLSNNSNADGYRPDGTDRLAWAPEQIIGRMGLEASEHETSVESNYRHVYSPEGRWAGVQNNRQTHA